MNALEKSKLAHQLRAELNHVRKNVLAMPGIDDVACRDTFVRQLIDSITRVLYFYVIQTKQISPARADGDSELFDPIYAAILHKEAGDTEEALWMAFLATHFGKSKSSGWRLARDFYGGLGGNVTWTWNEISNDVPAFQAWYQDFYDAISKDGIVRSFSNHRKYESLDPEKNSSTPAVIESYVSWIAKYGSHQGVINAAKRSVGNDRGALFHHLYSTMKVARFGRTGKFDFLTMVGKLGLWDIEPNSAYITNATGPLYGCRQLLGNFPSSAYDGLLATISNHLSLGDMKMQVLEDAICNWQKSPASYTKFRG